MAPAHTEDSLRAVEKDPVAREIEKIYLDQKAMLVMDGDEKILQQEFVELAEQIRVLEARYLQIYPHRGRVYQVFRFLRRDLIEYFRFSEMIEGAKTTYRKFFFRYGKFALRAYVALEIMERFAAPYVGSLLAGHAGGAALAPVLHQEYISIPLFVFYLHYKEKFRRWRVVAPEQWLGQPFLYHRLEKLRRQYQKGQPLLIIYDGERRYDLRDSIFPLSFPLWFRQIFHLPGNKQLRLAWLEKQIPRIQRAALQKHFGASKQVYALAVFSYLQDLGLWTLYRNRFEHRFAGVDGQKFEAFLAEKASRLYELNQEIDAARAELEKHRTASQDYLQESLRQKVANFESSLPIDKIPWVSPTIVWLTKKQFASQLKKENRQQRRKFRLVEKELYYLSYEHLNWFKQQLVDMEYHFLYDWHMQEGHSEEKVFEHYQNNLRHLADAYKQGLREVTASLREADNRSDPEIFAKQLQEKTQTLRDNERSYKCSRVF